MTTRQLDFTTCKRRLVQVGFSDGGAVLLREIDRRLQLTTSIASHLTDQRRKKQVLHYYLSLLRQRVFAICFGCEDLNEHDRLRTDPLIQTALN